jgi:hypothetical protein
MWFGIQRRGRSSALTENACNLLLNKNVSLYDLSYSFMICVFSYSTWLVLVSWSRFQRTLSFLEISDIITFVLNKNILTNS